MCVNPEAGTAFVPSVLETAESDETVKLSSVGHGPLLPIFEFDNCCIARPVGAAVGVSIVTPGLSDALLSTTAAGLLLPTDGLLVRAELFI